MPLLELGETQMLGVEPVQEVNGGKDVAAVTLVCGIGVTAAGRASAGVADDVPLGERTDEIRVPWWKYGHGPSDPVGEEGEILIAMRQDAGGDE